MGIYETIVEQLVILERQRDQATITNRKTVDVNGGLGTEVTEDKEHVEKTRPAWILDVDLFIQGASTEAGKYILTTEVDATLTSTDSDRLEGLSRILRTLSSNHLPVGAFLSLVDRIQAFKAEEQVARIAENLFEAGLKLSSDAEDLEDRLDDLQKAVTVLKRIVASSNSEVGEWVRRETRNQVFGQYADSA